MDSNIFVSVCFSFCVLMLPLLLLRNTMICARAPSLRTYYLMHARTYSIHYATSVLALHYDEIYQNSSKQEGKAKENVVESKKLGGEGSGYVRRAKGAKIEAILVSNTATAYDLMHD